MQVRVVHQILAPAVQHREEADLGAQMSGIGGDGAQRLGGGAEEKAVGKRLVLISDGGIGFRQREDDVEVLRVEKLGATILQPLRAGQRLAAGTMPVAATVEGDAPVAALIACFDVPAERGGPAQFDRRHDAMLGGQQRRIMLSAIGVAIAAEMSATSGPERAIGESSEVLRVGGRRQGGRRTR